MTDDRRWPPDLSDREAMRSEDDNWPSIADAIAIWSDRGARRSARLRARVHLENGLRVVYGQSDSHRMFAAGEIIGADQDLEAAIRRVGEQIAAPAQLIADCIASMKSERSF